MPMRGKYENQNKPFHSVEPAHLGTVYTAKKSAGLSIFFYSANDVKAETAQNSVVLVSERICVQIMLWLLL